MADLVSISANAAQIEEARAALSAKEFRQAMYQAVKRTTNAGRRIVVDRVRKEVGFRLKDAMDAIDVVLTHEEIPVGHITIKSVAQPLIGFKHTVSRTSGITATPDGSKSAIVMKHGFKATMRSGHTGLYERAKLDKFGPSTSAKDLMAHGFPDWEAREIMQLKELYARKGKQLFAGAGIRRTKRSARGGNFPSVNSSGIAKRFPIIELKGPRLINIVRMPEVEPEILETLALRLGKEIDSQINRFTNGQRITE